MTSSSPVEDQTAKPLTKEERAGIVASCLASIAKLEGGLRFSDGTVRQDAEKVLGQLRGVLRYEETIRELESRSSPASAPVDDTEKRRRQVRRIERVFFAQVQQAASLKGGNFFEGVLEALAERKRAIAALPPLDEASLVRSAPSSGEVPSTPLTSEPSWSDEWTKEARTLVALWGDAQFALGEWQKDDDESWAEVQAKANDAYNKMWNHLTDAPMRIDVLHDELRSLSARLNGRVSPGDEPVVTGTANYDHMPVLTPSQMVEVIERLAESGALDHKLSLRFLSGVSLLAFNRARRADSETTEANNV